MSPVPISSTSISLVPPSSVPIGAARHAQCSWSALHSRWVLWGMAFGVMVALTTPHPSKAAPVKLAFTGDVALTGAVGPSEATTTVPWAENPLRWMSPTLAAADLAVVNFEGVMTSKPWTVRPVGKSVLWVPFSGASVFMPAGVDLVSLANNHSYDA
ncbi:MAG: CapA family protein [Myxococcota bacterium]